MLVYVHVCIYILIMCLYVCTNLARSRVFDRCPYACAYAYIFTDPLFVDFARINTKSMRNLLACYLATFWGLLMNPPLCLAYFL